MAKAQLEFNLSTAVKDNKKYFINMLATKRGPRIISIFYWTLSIPGWEGLTFCPTAATTEKQWGAKGPAKGPVRTTYLKTDQTQCHKSQNGLEWKGHPKPSHSKPCAMHMKKRMTWLVEIIVSLSLLATFPRAAAQEDGPGLYRPLGREFQCSL